MHYIRMDAHKKTCQATLMNAEGRIIERKKIETDVTELKAFFSKYKRSRVVV